LIKRTSKQFIDNLLHKNPNWKILDIGCGYSPNKYATVFCDTQDLSKFYKEKKFIKLEGTKLPFENKEFDFVIASHVMEHVLDIEFFINELERISSNGYIELPTKLEDNLVFENKKDHLWHMDFDDVNFNIIISKKVQYIEPVLTVSSMKKFDELFRKSFVLELLWQDKINYILDKKINLNFTKSSLLSLLRKYISKKIRMLIK
jgi:SAM-dependent methyltransferase